MDEYYRQVWQGSGAGKGSGGTVATQGVRQYNEYCDATVQPLALAFAMRVTRQQGRAGRSQQLIRNVADAAALVLGSCRGSYL